MNDLGVLTIFTDGGSRGNPGPAAIGVHILNAAKETVCELSEVIPSGTNNEAEYSAIIASLKWLLEASPQTQIHSIRWFLDSKLVVEQLNGRWKLKQQSLKPFFDESIQLLKQLPYPHTLTHIPRELNRRADALVNLALDNAG